jgi:hypothetical protein
LLVSGVGDDLQAAEKSRNEPQEAGTTFEEQPVAQPVCDI